MLGFSLWKVLALKMVAFPTREIVDKAEWRMPLSPDGRKWYNQFWQKFLEARS
ncbi:MAG: hypothetical protein BroJett011_73970 [Chloroflexota bacterium]|nr:MAG: hypothetical protein BroJett011_73970 [Chloroflexota bacterium]